MNNSNIISEDVDHAITNVFEKYGYDPSTTNMFKKLFENYVESNREDNESLKGVLNKIGLIQE
jgi:hypothetical protein